MVSYESALERDFLLFCRTDHRVAAVQAQQLLIRYTDLRRKVRRQYTPDFLVELDAVAAVPWLRAVVEVKTRRDFWRSRKLMRAPYAAAQLWASREGQTIFRIVTDELMAGEWLINTRLLSGSLDKPFDVEFERGCAALLSAPDTYQIGGALKLAQQRGLNPDRVLPVLYRMVVRGELSIDRGQPIGSGTWVTVVGTQKRL